MDEDYHVPMTEFSVDERKKYQQGIELIIEGKDEETKRGLEQVFNVLGNAKSIDSERTLAFIRELAGCYRNLGRVLGDYGFAENSEISLGDLYNRNRRVLQKYVAEENGKDLDLEDVKNGIDNCLGEYKEILDIMEEAKISDAGELKEKLEECRLIEQENESFHKDISEIEHIL